MTRTTAPATTTTQPQCLHPSCHAHHAHPGNQPVVPATPAQPAAPRRPWYRKITKNMVIAGLIVIIIGLAGSLNDQDAEIAGLKAKIAHSHTAQDAKIKNLDYAIKLCREIAAKGDGPQCVTETLAQLSK